MSVLERIKVGCGCASRVVRASGDGVLMACIPKVAMLGWRLCGGVCVGRRDGRDGFAAEACRVSGCG